MRWLGLFYVGLGGWLVATGQVGAWAEDWLNPWGGLLLVPLVGWAMITVDEWMQPVGRIIEDLECYSERKTGKKNGWMFKLLVGGLIAWLLPVVFAVGESISGGR